LKLKKDQLSSASAALILEEQQCQHERHCSLLGLLVLSLKLT